MSILDVEKIINGTPGKRIRNGYNKMKENYTAESAQEYYNIYSKEPLSFLLENSRIIFSEPYNGAAFYESVMKSDFCCFNALESEVEKVNTFLEENGSNMSTTQKEICDNLKTVIESLSDSTKNTQIYASYIKEHIDDSFEEELSDLLFAYEAAEDSATLLEIGTMFESIENPIVFFTYGPYVAEKVDTRFFNELAKKFCEKASIPSEYNEEQWKSFVETVICCNKLKLDDAYMEKVHDISNGVTKAIFNYFMNTSITEKLDELVEEKSNADIHYSSRVSSINNIFMDMYEAAIDEDENNEFKEQLEIYKGIAYESTLDIIVTEYQKCNDTSDIASGYSLLTSEMTLDEAFESVNSLYSSSPIYALESDNEDEVSDDDVENMNKEVNNSGTESNKATSEVKDREIGGNVSGKKPQAPEPKNLANRIQFKAMDKEAKQQRKRAIKAQKGQERKNAFKAVMQLPKNVINSIKGQVKQADEADDERRKQYMIQPGFRKKAFRNLKVAILYGSAAQAKLSFVPIVAICRHFSKNKDRRIRNELVRELNTQIKVCEEKIADASAEGDKKEKYRLIRIKDQLDAELVRVKTNSKYV